MAGRPSFLRVIGKGLLWALAGAVLAPFVMLVVIVPLYYFNSACGTPGDSGGCEMGFAAILIASPIPGAAIGFLFGAARTFWRPAG
jgi:hypothetical protein